MLITERLNMKQFIKTFCVAAVAMGLCSVELKAQENGLKMQITGFRERK